jgi:hypothetical protein
MGPCHEFEPSAQWALEQAMQPWVAQMYRKAFPTFESSFIVRDDGWAQRGGIDRKINLKSARSVFIEEKFRNADYNDFYLERWSDKRRQKPGWIQQDLLADYVAYIFVPSRRFYLMPFLDLRRAWIRQGRYWIERYGAKDATNPRYVTEGVVVPIPVVLKAISDGFYLQWRAEPEAPAQTVYRNGQLVFDF